MNELKQLFSWNGTINKYTQWGLYIFYAILFYLLWKYIAPLGIPKPDVVWAAWKDLFFNLNLTGELLNSAKTCLVAMFVTIIIALLLAYISRIPFFYPIPAILTRFRFLSIIGLGFIFLLITGTSYQAKITTMSFSILAYLLTGLLAVIRDIPQRMYNYSRTLRMSESEVTWYTVVRGTLYEAIDLMSQNFAIAWMMLTSIETSFREYGGIGAMLVNVYQRKGFEYVFAIQITILIVGILLDSLLRGIVFIAFPWKRKASSNPLLNWIVGSNKKA